MSSYAISALSGFSLACIQLGFDFAWPTAVVFIDSGCVQWGFRPPSLFNTCTNSSTSTLQLIGSINGSFLQIADKWFEDNVQVFFLSKGPLFFCISGRCFYCLFCCSRICGTTQLQWSSSTMRSTAFFFVAYELWCAKVQVGLWLWHLCAVLSLLVGLFSIFLVMLIAFHIMGFGPSSRERSRD
jgi:hypothetical protein